MLANKRTNAVERLMFAQVLFVLECLPKASSSCCLVGSLLQSLYMKLEVLIARTSFIDFHSLLIISKTLILMGYYQVFCFTRFQYLVQIGKFEKK